MYVWPGLSGGVCMARAVRGVYVCMARAVRGVYVCMARAVRGVTFITWAAYGSSES